jgi:hypothetical protein
VVVAGIGGAAGGASRLDSLRLDPAIVVLPVGCPQRPSPVR